MQILLSIFFFIVAIGVLVTVHEFGHFWVARRLGVKVLRFSIGFGKPLWRWYRPNDDTEYVIAAIPLGGYVQMLDEREGTVNEQELHLAFNRKPLLSRFAVVFAGPLFNFLFAILAYWLVFMIGINGLKPIVGDVSMDSLAAKGGFQYGDVIQSVDKQLTPTWNSVFLQLLDNSLSDRAVRVDVLDRSGVAQHRQLDFSTLNTKLARDNLMAHIGIQAYRPPIPAVIGHLEPEGAAQLAGLQVGDHIIGVDDVLIHEWRDWVDYVRARPEQLMQVRIDRQGRELVLALTPQRLLAEGGEIGRIGAGVQLPENMSTELETVVRYSPWRAMPEAIQKTWQMSALTLHMLSSMVTGGVSASNISGPISIAQYAGYSASIGFVAYMGYLALISISLGVLNLLPIPVLDGGHLMYYLIEFIKGSPVSETVQVLGQRMGIAILMGVMALAFYNDFVRLFS